MEQTRYTSIERIFSKVSRDLGVDKINEADVIEWSAEALEAIGAVTLYEEAVAFIEVKNHQCAIPTGLHRITQVAYNSCYTPGQSQSEKDLFCPEKVIKELEPEDPKIDCGAC